MPRTQLDLFADTRPAAAGPAAGGGWPSTPRGESQLGLYDARSLLQQRARDAFARGRLDEAAHHYAELHARDPDDPTLVREAAYAANIRRQLAAAASASAAARPGALLMVADELASARDDPAATALRRALLREAALQAAADVGDAVELAGELPGFYLLAAGADEAALASLTRAAAVDRRARTLYLLADATMALRGPGVARPLYFEALLLDPFDHALRAARCENVRFLPEVALEEFAIADEPAAWCAPVGVVTGVLPCPPQLADHLLPGARASLPEAASEHQRICLVRARRFVQAMRIDGSLDFVADDAAVIEARRTMRELAPTLFAAHMQRRDPAAR